MIKDIKECLTPIWVLLLPFIQIITFLHNPYKRAFIIWDCITWVISLIPTQEIGNILWAIIFIGLFTKFICHINKKFR